MLINDWRGCPQGLCRRQRGCMAPDVVCSNARPLPPMAEADKQRAIGGVYRKLREAMEKRLRRAGDDEKAGSPLARG